MRKSADVRLFADQSYGLVIILLHNSSEAYIY